MSQPDTNQTQTGDGRVIVVEATSVAQAVADVSERTGVQPQVLDVDRVTRGGIGGFFAKEVVQVRLRLPATTGDVQILSGSGTDLLSRGAPEPTARVSTNRDPGAVAREMLAMHAAAKAQRTGQPQQVIRLDDSEPEMTAQPDGAVTGDGMRRDVLTGAVGIDGQPLNRAPLPKHLLDNDDATEPASGSPTSAPRNANVQPRGVDGVLAAMIAGQDAGDGIGPAANTPELPAANQTASASNGVAAGLQPTESLLDRPTQPTHDVPRTDDPRREAARERLEPTEASQRLRERLGGTGFKIHRGAAIEDAIKSPRHNRNATVDLTSMDDIKNQLGVTAAEHLDAEPTVDVIDSDNDHDVTGRVPDRTRDERADEIASMLIDRFGSDRIADTTDVIRPTPSPDETEATEAIEVEPEPEAPTPTIADSRQLLATPIPGPLAGPPSAEAKVDNAPPTPISPAPTGGVIGPVRWSSMALMAVGLPVDFVRRIGSYDLNDEASWFTGLVHAAKALVASDFSTKNIALVGPEASALGIGLGVHVAHPGAVAPAQGSVVLAAAGDRSGRRWVDDNIGTRDRHVVVGGDGWQGHTVSSDVVGYSWVGDESLPAAITHVTRSTARLHWGLDRDGNVRQATAVDIASAIRELMIRANGRRR